MTITNQSLASLRVNDPVIQSVVHGYVQADSIADFLAPRVSVGVRAGKVIKFGKEQFAVVDTRRTPGSLIQRVTTGFEHENFNLQQHAASGVVTEEEYQEAINGEARVDLRANAALRAANTIAQSWESEVLDTVLDVTSYESNCQAALSGATQFSNPGSDPEVTIQSWKEAVRSQIGIYPNAAVISTDVYNALKFHPVFRDRVKYTSEASINLKMLATWFDLPQGIKVAQRVKVNPVTGALEDMMSAGTMLLFYKGEGGMIEANSGKPGTIFVPANGADRANPSFAYTYTLQGYPIATKERFNEDYRTFITDIIVEQKIVLTGLGNTGKVGSGFIATSVV
jgi:hypothetical protein